MREQVKQIGNTSCEHIRIYLANIIVFWTMFTN